MAWESSAWNLESVKGDRSLPRHGKRTDQHSLKEGREEEGREPVLTGLGKKQGGEAVWPGLNLPH